MVAQRKPMAMASILDSCAGARRQEFAAGTILLSEGEYPSVNQEDGTLPPGLLPEGPL